MKIYGKEINPFVFLLAYPMWLLTSKDKRKSKEAFLNGLIPHECDWDFDNVYKGFPMDTHRCKYLGCNLHTTPNEEQKQRNFERQLEKDLEAYKKESDINKSIN